MLPKVESVEQLNELLEKKLLLIFKHSTRCAHSAYAFGEVQAFARANPEVSTCMIDVIAHREVSDRAAGVAEVSHQSPQALLFREGKLVWSASHSDVSEEAIQGAVLK